MESHSVYIVSLSQSYGTSHSGIETFVMYRATPPSASFRFSNVNKILIFTSKFQLPLLHSLTLLTVSRLACPCSRKLHPGPIFICLFHSVHEWLGREHCQSAPLWYSMQNQSTMVYLSSKLLFQKDCGIQNLASFVYWSRKITKFLRVLSITGLTFFLIAFLFVLFLSHITASFTSCWFNCWQQSWQ